GDPRQAHFAPRLSADGEILVWHDRVPWQGEIRFLRQSTGKTVVVRGLPTGTEAERWVARQPCLSPDGRWFIVAAGDGSLRRWDLLTGKEATPLTGAQRTLWHFVWSPDSRFVLAQGTEARPGVIDREAKRHVRAWDVSTGKRRPHLDLPDTPDFMLFSDDSS